MYNIEFSRIMIILNKKLEYEKICAILKTGCNSSKASAVTRHPWRIRTKRSSWLRCYVSLCYQSSVYGLTACTCSQIQSHSRAKTRRYVNTGLFLLSNWQTKKKIRSFIREYGICTITYNLIFSFFVEKLILSMTLTDQKSISVQRRTGEVGPPLAKRAGHECSVS